MREVGKCSGLRTLQPFPSRPCDFDLTSRFHLRSIASYWQKNRCFDEVKAVHMKAAQKNKRFLRDIEDLRQTHEVGFCRFASGVLSIIAPTRVREGGDAHMQEKMG